MKQFNLEEYLKNPDKKIVTRDGKDVRVICVNRISEDYPVVALIRNKDKKAIECYTKDGKFIKNKIYNHDLLFAAVKKSAWINLYKMNSIISPGPRAYDTKEEAESAAGDKSYYISTIKIEWEE